MAQLLRAQRAFDAVGAALEVAAGIDDQNPAVDVEQAWICYDQNRYEEARESAQAARAKLGPDGGPRVGEVAPAMGLALSKLGTQQARTGGEAERERSAYVATNPGDQSARSLLDERRAMQGPRR